MDDNGIFAWDNYDDNPLNGTPLTTIETAKEATYAPVGEGELVVDAFETFTSNADEYAYPQVAEVAGEEAKVLVFGEGFSSVLTITAKSGTYTETSEVPTSGDITKNIDDYVDIKGKLAEGDSVTQVTLTVTDNEGVYTVTPSSAEIGDNTGNYTISYANGTWTEA